jgi:hypothetical protein
MTGGPALSRAARSHTSWSTQSEWTSPGLVHYSEKFDEYGIIVHNGGTAVAVIAYCPWCGTRLPQSARDRWFDEVWMMGLEPESDEIPAEHRDGRWRQAAF